MPGRHVLDVDDVDRAVDVGGDPPQQEAPHDARSRSAAWSPRPSTCAGQTMTTGEPARGDPQRLDLGRVLGVRVRDAEPAARTAWRSSAAPPGGAGPIAATEEVWTTRSTPAAQALLEHHARALDVGLRTARPRGARRLRRAGDVEHARRRPRSARRIARRSVMSAIDASRRRAPSSASRFEVARTVTRTSSPRATSARATMRADEPGRAGDERGRPSVREATALGSAPMARRRRRHRHDALPAARGRRAARDPPGLPVRELARARPSREADITDFDAFYDAAARARASCRAPRSRRSATSSRSTSRCSRPGDDIVSIHLSGGISGTVRAAEQARDR